jgi:hypothetical protein
MSVSPQFTRGARGQVPHNIKYLIVPESYSSLGEWISTIWAGFPIFLRWLATI